VRAKYLLPDSERIKLRRRELAVTWAMVVTTGVLVGSVAYASSWAIAQIVNAKFDAIDHALERTAYFEGWMRLSAFVLGLAMVAAALTRWAPEAAGSGIPHVKAYLNGNRLDGALRPRTLVAKVIGIVCCVAIGMPAGREGPMVHAGAIVANIVGTGRSKMLMRWLRVDFHNDFVRRDLT
jgi:chloride channel 7